MLGTPYSPSLALQGSDGSPSTGTLPPSTSPHFLGFLSSPSESFLAPASLGIPKTSWEFLRLLKDVTMILLAFYMDSLRIVGFS